MKQLLLFAILLLPGRLFAISAASGFCEVGNQRVNTQGQTSSTFVQKSYPSCTITVYVSGTTTVAAIYSDNAASPTVLANPFTANANGTWTFFAPNGTYDVVKSAGSPSPGISPAITTSSVTLFDPSVASGLERDCASPKFGAASAAASTRIAACIANLPTAGGIANAEGVSGALSADIFAGVAATKNVHLKLGVGPYAISVLQTSINPNNSITGLGSHQTNITCSVNGDCIRLTSNPWNTDQAGIVGRFTLTGTSAANAVGIHAGGITGAAFRDLVVTGFTGASSAGIWLDSGASFTDPAANFTERTQMIGVDFVFNTVGLKFTVQTAATSNSFFYSHFIDMRFNVGSGQTGILMQGDGTVNGSPYIFNEQPFNATINCINGGTMWKVLNGATLDINTYGVVGETTAGAACVGLNTDSNSFVGGTGTIDIGAGSSTTVGAAPTIRPGANDPGGTGTAATRFIEAPNTIASRSPVSIGGYGTYMMPDLAAAGAFLQGVGQNVYFNGSTYTALGNGSTNAGAGMMFDGARYKLIVTPTTGGANQNIAAATFAADDRFSCVTAGCTIGPSASFSNIAGMLTASAAVNFGTVTAFTCTTASFSLPGALVSDTYFASSETTPTTGITGIDVFGASTSAPNVRVCNVTAGNIAVGSITVHVDAWRH